MEFGISKFIYAFMCKLNESYFVAELLEIVFENWVNKWQEMADYS